MTVPRLITAVDPARSKTRVKPMLTGTNMLRQLIFAGRIECMYCLPA